MSCQPLGNPSYTIVIRRGIGTRHRFYAQGICGHTAAATHEVEPSFPDPQLPGSSGLINPVEVDPAESRPLEQCCKAISPH